MSANSKLMKEVLSFLSSNENMDDSDFHSWAEENGYDVHEAEEAAYSLVSLLSQFILKGKANEKGVSVDGVDQDELEMGVNVEMEHTSNPVIAKRIALDHLAEIDDYYTRLKAMEESAGVKH